MPPAFNISYFALKIIDYSVFQTDVPDAPRNVECVEVSPSAIGIEWTPPRRDGGAPIRTYIVERRQGYSSRFLAITRATHLDTYYRYLWIFATFWSATAHKDHYQIQKIIVFLLQSVKSVDLDFLAQAHTFI